MRYRLAFSTLGCPEYSIERIIDAAVMYGYSGVSLRTVRGVNQLTTLEEFSHRAIGSTALGFRRANVDVVCIASGIRFTSADAAVRAKELETASAYIDIASGLGSPYVRIMGGPIPDDRDRGEVMENIVDGFRKSCDIASKKGVSVILETHDSFSRGKDAAELVREIDRNNLFIVWDVLHSLRFGESLEETWRYAGEFIRHVHLKDSTSYGPEGFDLNLLGRGKIPLEQAVRLLVSNGYAGYLEFEWEKFWHPEIPDASLAFPHGAGFLEGVMAALGA